MGLYGILRQYLKKKETEQPEVEVTDYPEEPTYVVAGDLQEFKMWKRVRKPSREAVYITGLEALRGVRGATVIFTGTWNIKNPAGLDLWEYANASGNAVEEDIIL